MSNIDEVISEENDNDGSGSAPVNTVVEEDVVNGQLEPDATDLNLTVNSRSQ